MTAESQVTIISSQLTGYLTALRNMSTIDMNSFRTNDFEFDFVHKDATQAGPQSSAYTKQFWPAWFKAFPEMDFEVTRTIVADQVAVIQWIFTGENSGSLVPPLVKTPFEPTNRVVRLRGMTVFDFEEELIRKETTYFDLATLLVELGKGVK